MAKVTAQVTNAIVGGKGDGEKVELDENHAKYLEGIGYIKVTGKSESPKPKPKAAPKKEAKQEEESKPATKDAKK